jgi:hypothetical protein
MPRDEYGQPKPTKFREWGIKINLLALPGLWRKIWGPPKNDIDERLADAKRRDAEFEAWFSVPARKESNGNDTA